MGGPPFRLREVSQRSVVLLNPTTIRPNETGVVKNEHLIEISQFFLDSPVKMHPSSPKKTRTDTKSIRGFPCFILKIFGRPQSSKAIPKRFRQVF
jgi:hypothetical protein